MLYGTGMCRPGSSSVTPPPSEVGSEKDDNPTCTQPLLKEGGITYLAEQKGRNCATLHGNLHTFNNCRIRTVTTLHGNLHTFSDCKIRTVTTLHGNLHTFNNCKIRNTHSMTAR